MEELKLLNFEFQGKVYPIEFPNIGNFKKIEVLKQALSNGMYGQMVNSNMSTSSHALDMIDIEAYLGVMCPDLVKDIKGIDSLSELSLIHFNELRKAYRKQFTPWLEKVLKTLSEPIADED